MLLYNQALDTVHWQHQKKARMVKEVFAFVVFYLKVPNSTLLFTSTAEYWIPLRSLYAREYDGQVNLFAKRLSCAIEDGQFRYDTLAITHLVPIVLLLLDLERSLASFAATHLRQKLLERPPCHLPWVLSTS
jgi:hypothetical protein